MEDVYKEAKDLVIISTISSSALCRRYFYFINWEPLLALPSILLTIYLNVTVCDKHTRKHKPGKQKIYKGQCLRNSSKQYIPHNNTFILNAYFFSNPKEMLVRVFEISSIVKVTK